LELLLIAEPAWEIARGPAGRRAREVEANRTVCASRNVTLPEGEQVEDSPEEVRPMVVSYHPGPARSSSPCRSALFLPSDPSGMFDLAGNL